MSLKFRCVFNNVSVDHFPIDTELLEQITWKSTKSRPSIENYLYLHKNKSRRFFVGTSPRNNDLQLGDFRLKWKCFGSNQDDITVLAKMDEYILTKFTPEYRILWKNFTTENLSKIRKGVVSKDKLSKSFETSMEKWRRRGFRVTLFFVIIFSFINLKRRMLLKFSKRSYDRKYNRFDFVSGLFGSCWCLMIVTMIWMMELPITCALFVFYLIGVAKFYCNIRFG